MRSEQEYHRRKAAKATAQEKKDSNKIIVRLSDPITLFSGILMLATVALVIVGVYQLRAISGQLDEMRKQRVDNIAQSRANIREDQHIVHAYAQNGTMTNLGEPIANWYISSVWKNAGNTDAIDVVMWGAGVVFDYKKDAPHVVTYRECPTIAYRGSVPKPTILANGATIIQEATPLSKDDALAALRNDSFIIRLGHIKYKDIYYPQTPEHFIDWCERVVPNDLEKSAFSYFSLKFDVDSSYAGAADETRDTNTNHQPQ